MGTAAAIRRQAVFRPASHFGLRLASGGTDDNGGSHAESGKAVQGGEDLNYRVEIWDVEGKAIERTLAIAADGTLGYAAYYAAVREYPGRIVSLRYRHQILSRSHKAT